MVAVERAARGPPPATRAGSGRHVPRSSGHPQIGHLRLELRRRRPGARPGPATPGPVESQPGWRRSATLPS
jgi:hypothetical protein